MKKQQPWEGSSINGLCVVCRGDAYSHVIYEGEVLWCTNLYELITDDDDIVPGQDE